MTVLLAASAATGQRYQPDDGNYINGEVYTDYEPQERPVHPTPRSYSPAAAPRQQQAAPKPTPVAILKQINRHNEDGSYTYGFEGADGSFKVRKSLIRLTCTFGEWTRRAAALIWLPPVLLWSHGLLLHIDNLQTGSIATFLLSSWELSKSELIRYKLLSWIKLYLHRIQFHFKVWDFLYCNGTFARNSIKIVNIRI